LAKLRILVAEDESLIALNLETLLAQLGCVVVGPVSEVQQIERVAAAEPLDGALVDVDLRGKKVFEALRFRSSSPRVMTIRRSSPRRIGACRGSRSRSTNARCAKCVGR
jgi:CheY-like chemotaxis protein